MIESIMFRINTAYFTNLLEFGNVGSVRYIKILYKSVPRADTFTQMVLKLQGQGATDIHFFVIE